MSKTRKLLKRAEKALDKALTPLRGHQIWCGIFSGKNGRCSCGTDEARATLTEIRKLTGAK